MNYTMEELVPIVGKLAEKYTANESTSITYEKADQLMEAVLYCIHELELEQDGGSFAASTDGISAPVSTDGISAPVSTDGISVPVSTDKIPAQQAYETGLLRVESKVKKALDLYNSIMTDFRHYENKCFYRTFVLELPRFFQRYDARFDPQNTILILDYPVLKDISEYTGIDKIYEYIRCIYLEQRFLGVFPREYVTGILSKYGDETGNLCEPVLIDVIRHILLKKPLAEPDWTKEDHIQIQAALMGTDVDEVRNELQKIMESFVQKYCAGDEELLEYLLGDIKNIAVQVKRPCD